MSLNDINSISHLKWNCKYHIVFAPKFRRKVFYGEEKWGVGKILSENLRFKDSKTDANKYIVYQLKNGKKKRIFTVQQYYRSAYALKKRLKKL